MNKFHRQTAYAAAFSAFFIMAAWIFAGMMIRPAASQEPNAGSKQNFCQSITAIHSELGERLGDVPHTSRVLFGLPAKRFVKAFNEYGEQTNLQADAVGFFVSAANLTHVLVTFETSKCVSDRFLMPVRLYVELIQKSQNMTGDNV